jgi:hypothetical protein
LLKLTQVSRLVIRERGRSQPRHFPAISAHEELHRAIEYKNKVVDETLKTFHAAIWHLGT